MVDSADVGRLNWWTDWQLKNDVRWLFGAHSCSDWRLKQAVLLYELSWTAVWYDLLTEDCYVFLGGAEGEALF